MLLTDLARRRERSTGATTTPLQKVPTTRAPRPGSRGESRRTPSSSTKLNRVDQNRLHAPRHAVACPLALNGAAPLAGAEAPKNWYEPTVYSEGPGAAHGPCTAAGSRTDGHTTGKSPTRLLVRPSVGGRAPEHGGSSWPRKRGKSGALGTLDLHLQRRNKTHRIQEVRLHEMTLRDPNTEGPDPRRPGLRKLPPNLFPVSRVRPGVWQGGQLAR